jgi:hypothetical protein
MEHAKQLASLVVALGLLGHGLSQAQEASPAATAEPSGKPPSAQEQPAATPVQSQAKVEADKSPAKPAQPQRKPPPRRRSVQQIVGLQPTINLGAPVYSPTLTPRSPIGSTPITSAPIATPAPGAVPAPIAPAPAIINSCAGSLCTDASGSRYNIGTGNAGTNSQGRLCNQVGNTVQCF